MLLRSPYTAIVDAKTRLWIGLPFKAATSASVPWRFKMSAVSVPGPRVPPARW
jgi:hypothetical protein